VGRTYGIDRTSGRVTIEFHRIPDDGHERRSDERTVRQPRQGVRRGVTQPQRRHRADGDGSTRRRVAFRAEEQHDGDGDGREPHSRPPPLGHEPWRDEQPRHESDVRLQPRPEILERER
jgi:hypothetical protein